VFIAVGTPQGDSGDADLQYVLAAAEQIGKALRRYTVIVNKSTVPVGTAEEVRAIVARNADLEFDVVSNPEFLKEGAALEDFLKPDRVIIGTNSARAREVLGKLYAPFVRTEHPIVYMDPVSAELTKYVCNAMLATRLSFMNDVAQLCEKVGADVDLVRKGMGADRRIGYPFPFPGLRIWRLLLPQGRARAHRQGPGLRHGVRPAPGRRAHQREDEAGAPLEGAQALRRPRAQDVRRLGAGLQAEHRRHARGALHRADRGADREGRPGAVPRSRLDGPGLAAFRRPGGVCAERLRRRRGADGLFLVTEWTEFRRPDFKHLRQLMRLPVIFDGRNVFKPQEAREEGFTYYGIGRS